MRSRLSLVICGGMVLALACHRGPEPLAPVLPTERVYYDGDYIRSDTKVAAEGPGYTVTGNGLVARTDGSAIELSSGVAGQLQAEARR